MTQFGRLRGKLAEICDLRGAAAVLGWDQQTYMPPGGAAARSEQLATLERLSHEMFISPEVAELIEGAAAEVSGFTYDSDEASLVRVTRRDYEKARKVPPSLIAEIARTTSIGMEVWVKAKAQSDFAAFKPVLQKIFQLQRDLANCFGYEEHVYDALLDQYEPGMKTALLKDLFAGLKQQLVPVVQSISQNLHRVDDAVLHAVYDVQKQWDFGIEVLKRFGYDLKRGARTNRFILSRHHSPSMMYGSRRGLTKVLFLRPSSARCMSAAMGFMSKESVKRWSARLWAVEHRWESTNHSRGFGKTWSGEAVVSGSSFFRGFSLPFPKLCRMFPGKIFTVPSIAYNPL